MADRNEELERRLQATFRVEAEGHLQVINAELDSLLADPGQKDAAARIETLFRAMHTLKGAARSVGFATIEALCHRSESLLSDATKQRLVPTMRLFVVLRDVADGLAALFAGALPPERLDALFSSLESMSDGAAPRPPAPSAGRAATPPSPAATPNPPSPAPAPAAAPSAPAEPVAAPAAAAPQGEAAESVRVEVSRLDRLVTLTEDLLIPKLVAGERMRLARELLSGVRHLRDVVPAKSREAGRGRSSLDEALRDVESMAQRLSLSLAEDHKTLQTTVDDLVSETRRARMMPAASMLDAFPRMVRDLCRETGKDVAWRVTGAEVEIDRKILDIVKDPLIHLVRNAVDHGIEPPAARTATGKPARGTVAIHVAALDEAHVRIEISDDGRGMGVAAIKDAALRARSLTAEDVAALDETEVMELAFRAGVSTSPVISNISGHGLGLSIVREKVERLEGKVTVAASSPQGTVIRIDLPVSIATYRGLLVAASGASLLWPLDSVERAIALPADALREALASGLVVHDGATLPFARLSAVLKLPRQERDETQSSFPCVVAHGAGRRGVFLVDAVLGEQEVLVKDLQPPLRRLCNIAAAGVLGTGELVLVLRPSDALLSMQTAEGESESRDAPAVLRARRILVVDDSITTRTMERNLFESAGYRVRVAADGLEAWNLLQTEEIDLIVSDIDMPRMNGFDLTVRVRADKKTAALPIVLVTALESREDKERGIQVGANAYVMKSTFDQSNLIDIVGRLL